MNESPYDINSLAHQQMQLLLKTTLNLPASDELVRRVLEWLPRPLVFEKRQAACADQPHK